MKALIIYNSMHGTTKAYAFEIQKFLKENGIESEVSSIEDFNPDSIAKADTIFLGAWTSGLMIFGQHPEKKWKLFASKLPDIKAKKVGLFTTYLLATGSMFRNMEKCLTGKIDSIALILKSKSSKLTEKNKEQLKSFISL